MPDHRTLAAINAAIRHLDTARNEAEAAAVAIVHAVEEVSRVIPSGAAAEPLGRILESCTFQDVIGQRLTKVAALLDHLGRYGTESVATPPAALADPADGVPREQVNALFARGRAPQGVPWRRSAEMKPRALRTFEESLRRGKPATPGGS